MGEISRLTFTVALAFVNVTEYCNSDFKIFKMFICDGLAILCTNSVNFGPVTLEFKRVKGVHPLVDQQFGYAVPLLDLAGSVLSFLWRSPISFVSVIC